MLKQVGGTVHTSKLAMKERMASSSGKAIFSQRPLPPAVIEYAAMDVTLLLSVHQRCVIASLSPPDARVCHRNLGFRS